MRPLKLEVVYRLDLTNKIKFGPIKKQTLYERFTDGRISGLLSEDLANALYNNVTKSPSEKSTFDIMDDEGRKYECRTLTDSGASLLPSSQVGVGRSYNETEHIRKIEALHAYIFTDIRNSPIFKIVAIPIEDLGKRKRISSKQFDELIENYSEVSV